MKMATMNYTVSTLMKYDFMTNSKQIDNESAY